MEKALRESLKKIGEEIKSTIENTSPELVSDIMDTGIILTGGGALIKNIDEYVYNATRIQTFIAENPLDSVAVGTGLMLNPKSSRKGMKINE
jgi:rod shape-determining protein MreB